MKMYSQMTGSNTYHVVRRSVFAASTFAFILGVTNSFGTDFHVLLIYQTVAEQLARPATGSVLINGGYEQGIEPGLTGDIWQLTDVALGSQRLGGVTVQDVTATEATCSVILDSGQAVISPSFRISISPVGDDPAELLSRAGTAYDDQDYRHALFYYEKLWWLASGNPIVAARTPECRKLIDSTKAQGRSSVAQESAKSRFQTFVDLAHRYLKLGDGKMANAYIDKLMKIDSTDSKVRSLRMMTPTENDFSPLHTDCYPIPPYNDSTAPTYTVRFAQWHSSTVDPYMLLFIEQNPAQFALLISPSGRASFGIITRPSGSAYVDRLVLRSAWSATLPPIVVDKVPTASWVKYEIELPKAPLDSLIAGYLEESAKIHIDIPEAYRTWEMFFSMRKIDLSFYREVYHIQDDSTAIQRKVDSIIFAKWPQAFQSKYWKNLKNKPEYFKEWANKKKRR